jgi:chemotaxis protein MotA
MDLNLVIGVLIAIVSIYFGIADIGKDLLIYAQLNSLIMVLGGTLGSTLISTSWNDFINLFQIYVKVVFGKRPLRPSESVKMMVDIAAQSQTMNKHDLVDYVSRYQNSYLNNAVQLISIGFKKEFVNQTLVKATEEYNRRNIVIINMVRKMGSYAPMFGMAGTVMGVILVLKNINDITNIVSGMALALLTTLYGLFLSSIVFIPISNKIQLYGYHQSLSEEIIREGVCMIMDKEIPLKVEKYLNSFLDR